MSNFRKEDTETATTQSSTLVGDFRKVDEIEDGTVWDKDVALSIFYQFIIPTTRPMKFQQNVQDGLTTWLSSKSEWEADPDLPFDREKFNQINKEALEILLNSTLLELQDNPDKYTKQVETEIQEKQEDGSYQEKTVKIPYGYNLQNPKGFSIADTPEEDFQQGKTYKELMGIIRNAKVEISALNETIDEKSSPEVKKVYLEKKKVQQEQIENAEEILEQMKNFTFNDEVTLKEVIQNTKDAQRFYLRLSFDPDDPKAAIALGNLIGEDFIRWEENQQAFEDTFGVSWKDYTDKRKEMQEKYLRKLKIPRNIANAIENNEEVELDFNEFIEIYGFDNPELYPISVKETRDDGELYTAEIDDLDELKSWVSRTEPQLVGNLLQKYAEKYAKEINNIIGEYGAGTWVKLEEPRAPKEDPSGKRTEFRDRPIPVEKDDYLALLGTGTTDSKGQTKRIFDADTIKVPKKLSSKVQSNIKVKIDLPKETELNMKNLYARAVGAESEEVVGIRKDPLKKNRLKGTIRVDKTVPTERAQQYLPYFSALEQYKSIRNALTAFLRRTTSTTEESLEKKKKWISKGSFNFLEQYLKHLYEINEIQEEQMEVEVDLGDVDLDFFLDSNGKMKFTYDAFIKKISGYAAGNKGEQAFLQRMEGLVEAFRNLDIIKENYLDAIEEAEDILDESEEDEVERLSESEYARLSNKQKREYREAIDELERRGKEALEEQMASAEGQQREQQVTDDKDATEQAEQALSEGLIDADLDNVSIEDVETSDLIKYLTQLDGDDLSNTAIDIANFTDELKEFFRFKSMDINSASFKKMLNKFEEITKDSDGNTQFSAKEYIDIIESDVFIDGTESKGKGARQAISDMRDDLQLDWNDMKDSFKEPEKEDFIRIVNAIDLEDAVAEAMAEDVGFNDVRNALVYIDTRKLEVIIDLSGKQVRLKGILNWKSGGIHYLSYKTKGERTPFVQQRAGEPPTRLRGKPVDYAGREQVTQARPYDPLRYEYYKQIRTRASLLVGAVR